MLSEHAKRNSSGVWVDRGDPDFDLNPVDDQDNTLPAIYIFSGSANGDGEAYAVAEDGTLLAKHVCSHWGYMRHDLYELPQRKATYDAYYPDGYRVVILSKPRELPPDDVQERICQKGWVPIV